MKMFHVCRSELLNYILDEGLCVDNGFTGIGNSIEFYNQCFGCQPIFLTIDPVNVVETMLSSTWKGKYSLLEVLPPENIVDERIGYRQLYTAFPEHFKDQAKNFVCFDDINPSEITVLDWNDFYNTIEE